MFVHSAEIIPKNILRVKSIISREHERHIGKINVKLRNAIIMDAAYILLIIL